MIRCSWYGPPSRTLPVMAGLLSLVAALVATTADVPATAAVSSPAIDATSRSLLDADAADTFGPSSFGSVAVGGGGWVTGMSVSDDGRTRVVRTDTFGAYRWSGGRWELVTSSSSLPAADVNPRMSGGVLAVAVAPGDASVVFMAYDHGLYRSSDGARSWRRVLSGVSTASNDNFRGWGSRLVVDPRDPDVVYYGTQLDGLFVSRDGGSSWEPGVAGVPVGLRVDVSDKATRGAVNRPTNTMVKASPVASAGVSAVAVDRSGPMVQGRSAVVYAASYGRGVYRSSDGGVSWSKVSPAGVAAVEYLRVLGNGDVLVTALSDPTALAGPTEVWRLHEGRWSRTTPAKPATWRSIAADPHRLGQVALMATGGQLALSEDFGASWRLLRRTQDSSGDVPWLAWSLNGGTNYMSPGELVFDPVVAGRLWFTEGIGVWSTELDPAAGAVRWVSHSQGIEQLVPTDVVVPPGGKPVMTAWDRAIFRSEDPQTYPTHYGPVNQFGSAWSVDWSVSDPRYLVASVASHQSPNDPRTSGYSTDGGKTWTRFPTIPLGSTNAMTTFGFGSMAVGAPANVVWVPSYGKRPQYTTDGGKTWKQITLPGLRDYSLVDDKPYFVSRRVLAADKSAPGTFYLYVLDTGTFRSTDGAKTWTKMSGTSAMKPTDYHWGVSLKAVPGRRGELYLTPGALGGVTNQPFQRSTDGGATWTTVDGITGVTAFGFGAPFPGSDHATIYLAGHHQGRYGIYRSTDDAHTWTYLTDYPDGKTARITSLDGDKTTIGRLYLSIAGGGWTYGDLDTPLAADPTTPMTPSDPAAPASTSWSVPRRVEGRLVATVRATGPQAVAGLTVHPQVRWSGSSSWRSLAALRTSRRGAVEISGRRGRAGWFRFILPAQPGLASSRSRAVHLKATTVLRISRSGPTLRGRLTDIGGAAVRGVRVTLQVRSRASGWHAAVTRMTSGRGVVVVDIRHRPASAFRWHYPGGAEAYGVFSRSVQR